MAARAEILEQVSGSIRSRFLGHPLRVAIDGIDAAGKTTFADDLAPYVEQQGRPVVRASIDGFHRPRAERYQRGPLSPEGYYADSFDYRRIRSHLLEPLGPNGTRKYVSAVFDYVTDSPIQLAARTAPDDAVLLFDGIFLFRPELDDCGDFRIWIEVDPQVALQRALTRDIDLSPDIESRYRQRYMPAQRRYINELHPRDRADLVIENSDPANPRLLKCPV